MYIYIKRLFDIILSIFLLVSLSPIYLMIILMISLSMGRPILFKQERVGINEVKFKILKFRTMSEKKALSQTDSSRITPLGSFLRTSSLDELPGIINVLLGDMSFIGPRPLLTEYLGSYSARERKRHHVKPGLSGLAQVSGRNSLEWSDKLELDVIYVENISFISDLKIFFKTFLVILNFKQINFKDDETMTNLKEERNDA